MKVETRMVNVDGGYRNERRVSMSKQVKRISARATSGRNWLMYTRGRTRAGTQAVKGSAGVMGALNALLHWLTRLDTGFDVGMEAIQEGIDWVLAGWLVYPLTFLVLLNVGSVNKGRSCLSNSPGARQLSWRIWIWVRVHLDYREFIFWSGFDFVGRTVAGWVHPMVRNSLSYRVRC